MQVLVAKSGLVAVFLYQHTSFKHNLDLFTEIAYIF